MHSKMVYVAPGYLLFVQDGALLAQAFDAATVELRGEPVRIAEGVAYYRTIGNGDFTVSSNGVLAYRGAGDAFQLVWYDQRGIATDSVWAAQSYSEYPDLTGRATRRRRRRRPADRDRRHLDLRPVARHADAVHDGSRA